MSTKPENRYITNVHKHIPKVYAEKMHNPFRAGTADVWYSGTAGDLWVEYKYIEKLPTRGFVEPDLSARQRRWLNNRHAEGRNVAVIVGSPTGACILKNKQWDDKIPVGIFKANAVEKSKVAEWIFSQVGPCECQLPE